MDELTREEIEELMRRANRARRAGYTDAEVSEWLVSNVGIDREQLAAQHRALPPVQVPRPLSTGDLLSAATSGATVGLAGGLSPERQAELAEMGLGGTVRGAQAAGVGISTLAGANAAAILRILSKSGAGQFASLLRAGKLRKAAQELSPSLDVVARQVGGVAKKALKSTPVKVGAGLLGAQALEKKFGLLDVIFPGR